jgi:hypothetical protein
VKRLIPWAVLGLLLAALVAGAALFDRTTWETLVGDEATYLMAAESLAFDFDLTYTREDVDRFTEHWGRPPEGLILQREAETPGAPLTYGKPGVYPLAIAPFVRLSPTRGPFVANALWLALAAVLAARALRRPLGDAAPVWVAVFVFASVTFGHVLWAHMDLLLMVLVAIALALVYGERVAGEVDERGRLEELPEVWGGDEDRGVPRWARWVVAGVLLAVVALARPFYGALLLPVALAARATDRAHRDPGSPGSLRALGRKHRLLLSLVAGAGVTVLLSVAVNLSLHGTWTSYGGERMGFYSYTGFPERDFPAARWDERIAERPGPGSWTAADRLLFDLKPRVQLYNLLYFTAGRDVGVLPYFLPLLLGLVAFRRGRGRWALVLAVVLATAGFFYVRAFNFWGGGGSLANRYFLPLYPAFWFLAGRARSVLWPVVIALAAAPFLWPLWSAPHAYPFADGYGWVSPVAERFLPYETTQDHLKPSGRDDFVHGALWIKPLTPAVRGIGEGTDRPVMEVRPGGALDVLVGSPQELTALTLSLPGDGAPGEVDVAGAEVGYTAFTPDGGALFELLLEAPTARHRMWWDENPWYLYRIRATWEASSSSPVPVRLSAR